MEAIDLSIYTFLLFIHSPVYILCIVYDRKSAIMMAPSPPPFPYWNQTGLPQAHIRPAIHPREARDSFSIVSTWLQSLNDGDSGNLPTRPTSHPSSPAVSAAVSASVVAAAVQVPPSSSAERFLSLMELRLHLYPYLDFPTLARIGRLAKRNDYELLREVCRILYDSTPETRMTATLHGLSVSCDLCGDKRLNRLYRLII